MKETLFKDIRFEWINWMKAFGIYLVVLGHFYSIGEKFIYSFHVPLFFMISGILSKKEVENLQFWKKLWYNLIVPMLIMAVFNFLLHCLLQLLKGSFNPIDIYWFVRNIVFGMVAGIDTLWFVYTLVILKIFFQYSPSISSFYSFTVIMLALAYLYNNCNLSNLPFFLSQPNAIVNVSLAFPFYALGVFVRDYRFVIDRWNHRPFLILIALFTLFLVSFCTYYNGYIGLYRCNYGGNLVLCILGGVAGGLMIFVISKLFGQTLKCVNIVARGTIIILGFHKLFIDLNRLFFSQSPFDLFFAAIIVILFVPIIVFTEKYIPLIMGRYRIKK